MNAPLSFFTSVNWMPTSGFFGSSMGGRSRCR
jgi:hypothetical protein